MTTPRFFFAQNPETYPDQEIIICTEAPYIMARVLRFKQEWKALRFEDEYKYPLAVRMPDYYIYFCLMGSIKGSRLSVDSNWQEKYTEVLKEMMEFYRKHKLDTNPYQAGKYKIPGI